jgi:predicted phage terminase large subunit-like protein
MALQYSSPRDEFVRSLERGGRGITIGLLAKKWGMRNGDIRTLYLEQKWEEARAEYIKKIAYYTEEKSAKSVAAKLAEIDEEADRVLQLGMKQAENWIVLRYMYCQGKDCDGENLNFNPTLPTWTCTTCGNMNRMTMRPQDMQYWTIMTRGIHDQRRKIYGGDKISTQDAFDRSVFQEQRNLYEWDLLAFAKAVFPHLVPDYFCQLHIDSASGFKERNGIRGFKEVIAAPRGYAKTTFDVTIETIHDCLYGHEKFILIVSSTSSLSVDKVKAIRDEMDTNIMIKTIYGDMKGPKWNQDDFVTSNGTRVMAVSPKTQVRGLNDKGNRPTKIILDDAENSEHVQTYMQREKMRKWFYEDISKLGTRHTNIKMVGTSLHGDALLEELFKNPGFNPRRYQAVIKFADESAQPLWEQWKDILVDIADPDRMKRADEFYRSHEAEMVLNSEVLWPQREPYVDLMKMRLFEGNTAFQLEKQNNPLAEDRLLFDMDDAGRFNIGVGKIIRSDTRIVDFMDFEDRIVAFLDPVLGQGEESDFAACPVLAKDKSGYKYVLDCFMKQFVSPNDQIRAVVDLLWKWKVTRLGIETNGFQSLLVVNMKEAIAQKAIREKTEWTVKIVPVTNLRAKHVRISTMEPSVTNRWIWFSDALPPEYFEQFRKFRPVPDAGYDDGPDATEGAIRVMEGNLK